MIATKEIISMWFDEGKESGATHMIVVCDTFDHDDYPVYVSPNEDVRKKAGTFSNNMQRVMEIYDLSMDKDQQMAEHRAFHY